MTTVTTNDGAEIYFKDWGDGPVITFSHGWPLNADAWDGQMLFLARHGYRCVAIDRRGHGRSTQTSDRNDMDGYADERRVARCAATTSRSDMEVHPWRDISQCARSGKVAIVTSGSSSIGPAAALGLARQSAKVIVHGPSQMERHLAAILAADVVGYSRLMEQDEAGTFERLRAHRRELFEPEIAKHHGRVFKLMGDGLLAEFLSVADAVECAVALQTALAGRNAGLGDSQRIDMRMGINLGDVIVEGEDRYGEGVNIAARLQALAEPGGITVSRTVAEQVKHRLGVRFEPLGKRQVKNIAEPVYVYRIRTDPVAAQVSRAHRLLHKLVSLQLLLGLVAADDQDFDPPRDGLVRNG